MRKRAGKHQTAFARLKRSSEDTKRSANKEDTSEAHLQEIHARSYRFNVDKLGLPKAEARRWADGTVRAIKEFAS